MDVPLTALAAGVAVVIGAIGGLLKVATAGQNRTIETLVRRHAANGALTELTGEVRNVRDAVAAARVDIGDVRERLAVVESRMDHLPGSRR